MYAVLGNYPACVEVAGNVLKPYFVLETLVKDVSDICLKVLLKMSSNASLVDSSRRSALHWAVHHGHIACVK